MVGQSRGWIKLIFNFAFLKGRTAWRLDQNLGYASCFIPVAFGV